MVKLKIMITNFNILFQQRLGEIGDEFNFFLLKLEYLQRNFQKLSLSVNRYQLLYY